MEETARGTWLDGEYVAGGLATTSHNAHTTQQRRSGFALRFLSRFTPLYAKRLYRSSYAEGCTHEQGIVPVTISSLCGAVACQAKQMQLLKLGQLSNCFSLGSLRCSAPCCRQLRRAQGGCSALLGIAFCSAPWRR